MCNVHCKNTDSLIKSVIYMMQLHIFLLKCVFYMIKTDLLIKTEIPIVKTKNITKLCILHYKTYGFIHNMCKLQNK